MRLWHEALIPYLPNQQLLGQHRECCALRGKGWGRKHSTVDYVFTHPIEWLYIYHVKVMDEMTKRGYNVNPAWYSPFYRGKNSEPLTVLTDWHSSFRKLAPGVNTYPEHDDKYLKECLENLWGKGVEIGIGN